MCEVPTYLQKLHSDNNNNNNNNSVLFHETFPVDDDADTYHSNLFLLLYLTPKAHISTDDDRNSVCHGRYLRHFRPPTTEDEI